jgi:glycosyltransferase involved in cell wall biosynthesis
MANSLPIVATPVGGIPFLLEDRKHVLFTDIRSPQDLSDKLLLIINNQELRQRLILNGNELAEVATLEVQSAKFISLMKNNFN